MCVYIYTHIHVAYITHISYIYIYIYIYTYIYTDPKYLNRKHVGLRYENSVDIILSGKYSSCLVTETPGPSRAGPAVTGSYKPVLQLP